MKSHAFRMTSGQDLLTAIRGYALAQGIEAAYVGCAVGSLSHASLRDSDGLDVTQIDQDMEILSLIGTVSKHRTHLHMSLGKRDLSTIGGHVMQGCIVHTTVEIVLCELTDLSFGAKFDESTGYYELDIVNRPTESGDCF